MIENHLDPDMKFNILENLEGSIGNFGCICIVQHHSNTDFKLREIYKNSHIPFIYDCQNKLEFDSKSKTILKKLGN